MTDTKNIIEIIADNIIEDFHDKGNKKEEVSSELICEVVADYDIRICNAVEALIKSKGYKVEGDAK